MNERILRPLGAGAGALVIFIAALAIPLSAADPLELSAGERVGWIMGLYAIPGLLTLALLARYRQPLLLTGNIFLLVFVASLGDELPWAELVGASMLADVIVVVMGPTGLIGWLTRWLPAPIVQALVAGAVLGFFVELFNALDDEPLLVGYTLVTYMVARRVLEPRIPALLPALLVGVAAALLLGETGSLPEDIVWVPSLTRPELSWSGVLTVTPVMVALVTVQANVPSLVLLRKEGYEPPDAVVGAWSGIGTAAGSLLGPIGLSLSLPITALCAGPDAGQPQVRHRSAYLAGAGLVVIGALAGAAAAIATAIPAALLAAFVGLALVNVFGAALKQVTAGPLTLGPLFSFAIAQSDLGLINLGPLFWAMVSGIAVSMVLEPEQLRALRSVDVPAAPKS